MRKPKMQMFKKLFMFLFFSFLLLSLEFPGVVEAFYSGMSAKVVIGQPNFTIGSVNQGSSVGANTLSSPRGMFTTGKRLLVGDLGNNRVLIFNSIPTTNNASADIVIGQPDFASNSVNQGGAPAANTLNHPDSVFSDGKKLFITDFSNHRVLIFNSIPTTNNASADIVIGQPNMISNSTNCSGGVNKLCSPTDAIVVGNKLIVSDYSNRRVLIFNSIPTTNNASADVVIGQPDFNGHLDNQGGSVGANTISLPDQLVSDGTRLLIADNGNNRVLIFNSIPTTNNASADIVIGQPNMTSSSVNQGGVASANTLDAPDGLFIDSKGRLYVDDAPNNRVLIFNSIPTTNNASADIVIGQPNMTTTTVGTTVNTMSDPASPNVDSSTGSLFVAEAGNNRVLIFNNIISTPGISVNTPLERIGSGRLRFHGNVLLGEKGTYALQNLQANVNGQGFSSVTNFPGGRDNSPTQTIYEFYHDFEPWAGSNGNPSGWTSNIDSMESSQGYTIALKASSYNADDSSLFFFLPFKFASFTDGPAQTFNFFVNKYQIQRIKDNIDHFEVWVKKQESDWTKYGDNISTDKIDPITGQVAATRVSTLTKGNYDIKIKAISKVSKWQEDSNTISTNVSGVSLNNPLNLPIDSNFPLQINSISGSNTEILSTFNLSKIQTNYLTSNRTPIITGIAYAGSIINLNITNQKTSETKAYTTKVKSDSTFTINPTLYTISTIDMSVYSPEINRFNLLPSFTLTINQSQPSVEALQTTQEEPKPKGPTSGPTPTPVSKILQPTSKPKACFLLWCW